MGILVTIPLKVVRYSKNQLEDWRSGSREGCSDAYLRNLSGTKGFGEYIVGKYFDSQGYLWMHRFGIFGGNKIGTFPEGDRVLKKCLGEDLFEKSRVISPNFKHLSMELPDLLIYKPDYSELKFVEVKRLDTRDKVREPQVRGLALLSLLLGCDVEIYEVVEEGKEYEAAPVTWQF